MINEKGEETGIIYGWYNTLTDMWYIGQTIDEKRRFKTHIDYAINKKDNNRFHNTLRKYGLDNFIYCVLEDNVLKENLNMRETDWIEYYDSFYCGYNLTSGGDTNVIISEETRRKLSESHKGIHPTEETRRKLSESHKGKGITPKGKGRTPWNKGIPMTEETRKKMSESHKRRPFSEETRKRMSESHKGKKTWNYGKTNVYSDETKRKISKARSKNKLINKYDLEGNFIKQYECLYDAKKENPKCSNISKVCRGKRRQDGGFIWKYA